jgi:transcriptional regulator with XRE-family HTH domain
VPKQQSLFNLTTKFTDSKNNTKREASMDEFEFLARLRKGIKESEYNQTQLAVKLGLGDGHFSQMLSGIKPLYLDRLLKILELIDFDLSFLVPQKYLRREVTLDMAEYVNPEAAKRLIDKIMAIDGAGEQHLETLDVFASGILSTIEATKKKVA